MLYLNITFHLLGSSYISPKTLYAPLKWAFYVQAYTKFTSLGHCNFYNLFLLVLKHKYRNFLQLSYFIPYYKYYLSFLMVQLL